MPVIKGKKSDVLVCTDCGLTNVKETHNCDAERKIAKRFRELGSAVANLRSNPPFPKVQIDTICETAPDADVTANAVTIVGDVSADAIAIDFDHPVSSCELSTEQATHIAHTLLYFAASMPFAKAQMDNDGDS